MGAGSREVELGEYADWLISVDDHVIEPPHLWERHISPKHRDRAPRVIRDDDGVWKWAFEKNRTSITGLAAVAGTPANTWDPMPLNLDSPPVAGSGDPKTRLAIMDQDHVIASLIYPTVSNTCGQTFLRAEDKDLGLACIRAYNDWMLDEWTATAPDRFIPLCLIPLWDAGLAAEEARRTAAKGAKSVSFTENPSSLGLPSLHDKDRYWDPLWKACVDNGLPLSIHLGTSVRRIMAPDAPLIEGASFMALGAVDAFIDWMWSGNLLRYPDLKIVLSESGIGWAPPILQRMRRDLHRWRWARTDRSGFEGDILTGDTTPRGERSVFGDIPNGFDPLEVFQRSIFPAAICGDTGWEAVDFLGPDNILIETDFPHPDSEFPNSAKMLQDDIAWMPEAYRNKILRENACRVYNFTPASASSLRIN
jgi:predicted TIM-barrel fold metal-dependent hydrolase